VIGETEIVLWRNDVAEFRLETWRTCAENALSWLHEATR
jgi:sarcosine oxidase gamma subunit